MSFFQLLNFSKKGETEKENFPEKWGVVYVRGCEVNIVKDEDGVIISDPTPGKKPAVAAGTFF